MDHIIVADITVFVGINVVDVIRIFIIVVYIIRVCIMTNNQLMEFFVSIGGFCCSPDYLFNSDSEDLLYDINLI